MALTVSEGGGGSYEQIEVGLQHAVCSHVVDMGLQESQYGAKEQVALVFETAERMQDGRPWMFTQWYSRSLHPKSNLRKDLEQWRGRAFTPAELKEFDLEKLLGACATLNIINVDKDGNTRQRIAAVSPPMKGREKLAPYGQDAPEWLQKISATGLANRESKAQDSAENPPADPQAPDGLEDQGLPF